MPTDGVLVNGDSGNDVELFAVLIGGLTCTIMPKALCMST